MVPSCRELKWGKVHAVADHRVNLRLMAWDRSTKAELSLAYVIYEATARFAKNQRTRRPERFDARIKLRKAVFTACSSGKCLATSGESSTRFVPARKRVVYLPRTPPFNLEKSYSLRSSSPAVCFSVFFFIMLSFLRRCLTSTNNPNVGFAVCMRNDQNSASIRHPHRDKTLLHDRMIGVRIRYRQRIAEDACRFLE